MTIFVGLGLCPLGTSPLGFGAPAASSAMTTAVSGGAVSSVDIDSVSRDLVEDSSGNPAEMTDAAQRVWLCLATLRGSRRNFLNWGFRAPSHITDAVLSETTEAVRVAMAPVLSDGSVELVSVTPDTDPMRPTALYALVVWRDTKNPTRMQKSKAVF